MDTAYIRDAATGRLLSQEPVTFLRLPERGELIANNRSLLTVVRVIHGWSAPASPVAWLDVAPAAAHTETVAGASAF